MMAQRHSPFPPAVSPLGLKGLLAGALVALGSGAPAAAREAVMASAPHAVGVTVYRDPNRDANTALNRDFPRGFALITERRRVTLPKGATTVRFDGVAEGMVAVSALVTGLPHAVEEQNRSAALLSPGALVDGSLGNRVTLTRTNPATGSQQSEDAIVRTRADGGLVLQTATGFEAVRCSGLAEGLQFASVPDGLSAQPVYSIATQGDGGTYEVVLSYLSWGFDWEAHHVARIHDQDEQGDARFGLVSWLTLVNSNGQSFADTELLVVAGTLNVDSNYKDLAKAPDTPPLQLECYPMGSTAQGSPEQTGTDFSGANKLTMMAMAPPTLPAMAMARATVADAEVAMVAVEEALGDLKLFRVPEPVTVAAKAQKQVAFLLRDQARGQVIYETRCTLQQSTGDPVATRLVLDSTNDAAHGLDASLPMGKVTVFESGPYGDLLLAEDSLRDTAKGLPVSLALGQSTPVQAVCTAEDDPRKRRHNMRVTFSNTKDEPVTARVVLGSPRAWRINGLENTPLKDGETVKDVTVPAHSTRSLTWTVKPADQKR